MPIITIPSQPLKLIPFHEPHVCQTGDDYCYLHQPIDPIRMQWKQTSGTPNVTCDPIFNGVGTEVLTNGTFSGSAAGWTLTNATYGGDKVCFDGTTTAGINQNPLGLDVTKIYRIIVEASGITTGSFDVVFGGATVLNISVDGLYTINVFPAGAFDNLVFATIDGCDGCVDNASVKELWPCWTYDNGSFFLSYNQNTGGNKITHIQGFATTLTTANALKQDGYYQFRMRVQNRTQGSVQMFAGDLDLTSTAITENGIFTQYLTAKQTGASTGDPVDLFFVMSSDFDGTIEYFFGFELRTDFICTLILKDGTPVADLSSHLVYNDNYVTLSVNGLQSILDYNGDPIDYGCYKIAVTDPGGTNYVVNGSFETNSDWFGSCYFGVWFDSGQATGVADGIPCTPTELVQPNSLGLVTGKYYIAQFKYKSSFIDAGNNIRFDVCGATVANVAPTTSFQQFISTPFQITNPANQIRFHFDYGDITNGNSMTIDEVSVYEVGGGGYVTNCINYQLSFPGSYSVVGQGQNIPRSFGVGFLFQPRNLYVFFLYQRLYLGFRKPKYPEKFNADSYSTGTHYKSFASSEKVYEVVFDPIGEIEHDALALMIQCPRFFIAGNPPFAFNILDQNRYQCITEEYQPDYDDKGEAKNVSSSIQVQHITDIVKISNI